MGGLIYIIGNSSLKEETIRIGKSKSNPNEFCKDELYSIGVPEPFVVECLALVDDHAVAERIIQKIGQFLTKSVEGIFTCTVSP